MFRGDLRGHLRITSLSNIRDLLIAFSPYMEFFAITTRDGRIQIWDTLKGQLQTEFADTMSADTSIINSKSERGADWMVCKIDPISGNILGKLKASVKAISILAVSLDGKLLAAVTAQLKIFNCSNEKMIEMFSGHPCLTGAVRCMIFAKDGNHIHLSSAGERYVAVWRIDGSKKQSAGCVLAMEHPAVFLDCFCSNDGELMQISIFWQFQSLTSVTYGRGQMLRDYLWKSHFHFKKTSLRIIRVQDQLYMLQNY